MHHRSHAQKDIFKRIHARIGKQQRGVVLDHQRSRRYYRVAFGGKKVEKSLADLARGHVYYLRRVKNRA